MPTLDVSSIILDPQLAQPFTLLRTQQEIDVNTGRVNKILSNISGYGVVTEGMYDPLARTPQYEVSKDTIKIVTQIPMYMVSQVTDSAGVTRNYEPDQALWKTRYYTMVKVYDYSTYGIGFYMGVFQIADAQGFQ